MGTNYLTNIEEGRENIGHCLSVTTSQETMGLLPLQPLGYVTPSSSFGSALIFAVKYFRINFCQNFSKNFGENFSKNFGKN